MRYYIRALAKVTDFSSRATRAEYWYFFLCNVIISFLVGFITAYLGYPEWANVYSFTLLVPSIAAAVRRMHDVGKSGWHILIPIYSLVLLAGVGEVGYNEYGPDPRDQESYLNSGTGRLP